MQPAMRPKVVKKYIAASVRAAWILLLDTPAHFTLLLCCTIDFHSKLFSSVYTFCLYTGLSDRLAVGS